MLHTQTNTIKKNPSFFPTLFLPGSLFRLVVDAADSQLPKGPGTVFGHLLPQSVQIQRIRIEFLHLQPSKQPNNAQHNLYLLSQSIQVHGCSSDDCKRNWSTKPSFSPLFPFLFLLTFAQKNSKRKHIGLLVVGLAKQQLRSVEIRRTTHCHARLFARLDRSRKSKIAQLDVPIVINQQILGFLLHDFCCSNKTKQTLKQKQNSQCLCE